MKIVLTEVDLPGFSSGAHKSRQRPARPFHKTLSGSGALPGRQALPGQSRRAGWSQEQVGDAGAPQRERSAAGLYSKDAENDLRTLEAVLGR
jgi:hypothetical protein